MQRSTFKLAKRSLPAVYLSMPTDRADDNGYDVAMLGQAQCRTSFRFDVQRNIPLSEA